MSPTGSHLTLENSVCRLCLVAQNCSLHFVPRLDNNVKFAASSTELKIFVASNFLAKKGVVAVQFVEQSLLFDQPACTSNSARPRVRNALRTTKVAPGKFLGPNAGRQEYSFLSPSSQEGQTDKRVKGMQNQPLLACNVQRASIVQ